MSPLRMVFVAPAHFDYNVACEELRNLAELIATGKARQQRWRQSIPEGELIRLGRAPRNGWSVPWDRLISREHAHIQLVDGRLEVSALETARNPIYYRGEPTQQFTLEQDDEFRIGETVFRYQRIEPPASKTLTVVEHSFGRDKLSAIRFRNASECLEAICEMPAIIARARSDADFASQIVDLLLDSLSGALAVAVVQFDPSLDQETTEPKLLRWNSRPTSVRRFRPSRRLMSAAMERRESVIHLWMDEEEHDAAFTMSDDLDWAFCTPIPTADSEKWCLYVSGQRRFGGFDEVRSPDDLVGELRLAELLAQFIGAVRQVRWLEHQQSEMRQFFSPAVVETLVSETPDNLLAPREGMVSVLFCDVRGFSQKVEESKTDLHQLLGRVSQALSVMTRNILRYEGVIADFQGDAALGFWGWPHPQEESPLWSCRAALAIQETFLAAQADAQHPLHGFRVGVGIGHGRAIAGRIGADEQTKVGVFGPVVNLASRLEDLTKHIGAPIMMDEATAMAVRETLPPSEGRIRQVARLRPVGIDRAENVYELMAPQANNPLTEAHFGQFAAAVTALIDGEWQNARELLNGLSNDDRPVAFLRNCLDASPSSPPSDWDGAWKMTYGGRLRQ